MSNPVSLTILAEDNQTKTFIRHFLYEHGWKPHDFRILPTPNVRGSGEQYVRKQFPKELKAYRGKCNHLGIALVAAVDADTLTVMERRQQLCQECRDQNIDPPQPEERVLLIIPKRNIETWLAYLRGETVNENNVYRKYAEESECKPQAIRLKQMCQDGQLAPTPAPASLESCCNNFKQFRSLIEQFASKDRK
jgi:hypothetical protein